MTPRIPEATIRRILEHTDILRTIQPYVKLRRVGVAYAGLCPFHKERTPSFTIQPKTKLFHCHGCGAAGNSAQFLMRMESISFPAAIQILADRAGISIISDNPHADRYAEMLREESMWLWRNAIDLGFGIEHARCLADEKWMERYLVIRANCPGVVVRFREERDIDRAIAQVYARATATVGGISEMRFEGLLELLAASVATADSCGDPLT